MDLMIELDMIPQILEVWYTIDNISANLYWVKIDTHNIDSWLKHTQHKYQDSGNPCMLADTPDTHTVKCYKSAI